MTQGSMAISPIAAFVIGMASGGNTASSRCRTATPIGPRCTEQTPQKQLQQKKEQTLLETIAKSRGGFVPRIGRQSYKYEYSTDATTFIAEQAIGERHIDAGNSTIQVSNI